MTKQLTTEAGQIESLMLASRPHPGSPEMVEASRALARQVMSAQPAGPAVTRSWRRPTIAAVATLALLVPVGTATASYLGIGAHTGRQVPDLHPGDHSEELDGCAADFPKVVTEYRPADQTLPPGVTWAAVDAAVARNPFGDCAAGGKYPQSVSSVRSSYMFVLFDGWQVSYLRAADRGDGPAMKHAANRLGEIAGSAATKRVIEDGTSSGVYGDIAAAAARGDVEFVRTRVPASTDPMWANVR